MPSLALWKGFLSLSFWDPCLGSPMPVPPGYSLFETGNTPQRLFHAGDFSPVLVRSDFALWCCKCGRFVAKSETVMGTVDALGSGFNGVF